MRGSTVRSLVVALSIAACSGGDDGTGPGEAGQGGGGTPGGGNSGGQVLSGTVEIRMSGASFSPSDVVITRGTVVRWRNEAGIYHTITPENATQAGVWQRQETSTAGVALEHTFDTAAQTYRYRCEPHSGSFTQGMVGSIRVQ